MRESLKTNDSVNPVGGEDVESTNPAGSPTRVQRIVSCDLGEGSGYELFDARDLLENSVLLPWLNLFWLEPQLARSPDQLRWVALTAIPQHVYDNPEVHQYLKTGKEKLKEIYPDSFLFRLNQSQLVIRKVNHCPISQEHLVNLCRRIHCVGSQDRTEGEIHLAALIHKAWKRTLTPIQSKSDHEAVCDYEALRSIQAQPSVWASFAANDKVNPVADSYATTPETEARNSGSTDCSPFCIGDVVEIVRQYVDSGTGDVIITSETYWVVNEIDGDIVWVCRPYCKSVLTLGLPAYFFEKAITQFQKKVSGADPDLGVTIAQCTR